MTTPYLAPPPAPTPRRRASATTRIAALLVGLVALALGLAVWFWATPYIAVRELQAAAERGDTQAIERLVDFPSLRASISAGLAAKAGAAAGGRGGVAGLAASLAGTLAPLAVDRLVRPEAVAAMVRGVSPETASGASARVAPATRPPPRLAWEDLDDFTVAIDDASGSGKTWTLGLRRSGLATWRLAWVKMP